jgi:hypothetical protein
MSDDKAKGNKTTSAVEFQETVAASKADAIKEAIFASLDAFDQHKEELLDGLRRVTCKPFDEDKAWRRLTFLAGHYFWRERVKQEITKPSDRKKRLRQIANALERACARISEAKQSDIGDDLYSAWLGEDPTPTRFIVRNDDGSLALVGNNDFEKAVAGLAELEAAARRAVGVVRTKDGRPKGDAVLPWGFIEVLATEYRETTGATPRANSFFAEFVTRFLIALGRYNDQFAKGKRTIGALKDDSVIDAIKNARTQSLRRAATNKGQPSPFDRSVVEKPRRFE